MRFATYNLHFGGHTRRGNHWYRLVDELGPDIVLAQETFYPGDYFREGGFHAESVVWQPLPSEWGSALFAPRHKLEPIEIPANLKGWIAGAKIAGAQVGGVEREVMTFSIHTPSPGPYENKVHKILDAIKESSGKSEIVIGGDFNITTAVRHSIETLRNTKIELEIIDRLRTEFGLINAWQAAHPNRCLPQTLRWSANKSQPYHCDAIFIPHSWLRYLESCEVITDGWTEMSDHNPILATFKSGAL